MAGWQSVEEIDAYCLAVQLRDAITELTETGKVASIGRSLGETQDALKDGLKRGYFTAADVNRLCDLADTAKEKTAGLIVYLQRTPTPKRRGRKNPPEQK